MMVSKQSSNKQTRTRKAPLFRKLTDAEAKEEDIYRRQMRYSWSFESGEHPLEIYNREKAEKGLEGK